MSIEEKKNNEILSVIAADLFAKLNGSEELSFKIHRLRNELKKVIGSEDSIFGKFHELVESFKDIIPEEKQRYHAAIKALSTTSKLSQQEIVKAVNNQLEELKILEKGLMPALPVWRDEIKVMQTKSREMRDEISKLREKIGQLESEEKGILNGMAVREKEMEQVEKAVGEVFTDIETEIISIKKRIEEFTAESPASQPSPPRDSLESNVGSEEAGSGEQKSEIRESSPTQDTKWQKKCPMCGGRMDFYSEDGIWTCYSCAYEEEKNDEVQVKSEEKGERTNSPKLTSSPESISDPLASLSSNEYQKSKKGSSPSNNQPTGKKKVCPVCRKKMEWHLIEKAWRCPFCEYERSI